MPGATTPTFGALLKRYRRAARLTQAVLAERAGYSVSYISMLERAERIATLGVARMLAQALRLEATEHDALLAACERSGVEASAQVGAVATAPEIAVGGGPAVAPAPDGTATDASSAIRTFLIADIRNYTAFTATHGDEAAAALANHFAELVREVTAGMSGHLLELRGDEALVVFSSARQALRAAVALQARLTRPARRDHHGAVPAGIGLDAGEAVAVADGYRGGALNLAARLCAEARAGEVLASEAVIHLARTLADLMYTDRGLMRFKGLADPVRVIQVMAASGAAVDGAREQAPRLATPTLPVGGFLGAQPEGVLVAREAEMGQVLMALDTAAGGAGQMILLAGEPGVGKTRLAQEITLHARKRGMLVATGRCYEPQQAVAYYPFLEALASLFEQAPATLRAELPRRWPELARLLPDVPLLSSGATGAPAGGHDERMRLLWQVAGFVLALAERQPVALLLDDLHWADAASVDLLMHLARHSRTAHVLLVGTYRDMEVQHQRPMQAALRELAHEHLVERVAVRRLGMQGTAALMASTLHTGEVSTEFALLVHEPTEGNPFFVQEVLRALVERGDVSWQDGRWQRRASSEIAVPESVRAAIGERVDRLSVVTQDLLREASVLGQRFTFEDLRGTGEHDEVEVEAALDEAVAAGLVREAGGDAYHFNHALTQRALYAELSTRRKRRLHRAAGEALERLDEAARERRVAELAWHFLEADEGERALPYSLRAGDQAEALFAHGEAERHYRAALDLARELDDEGREAQALEQLGGLFITVARYDEALRMLEQAVERHRAAGQDEAVWRAMAQVGRVHVYRGTPKEGAGLLLPLVEDASERAPSVGLAALHVTLAELLLFCGQYREQLAMAEQGAQIARALRDDRLLAQALVRGAQALLLLGQMETGARTAEDALPLARRVNDSNSLRLGLFHTGLLYESMGQFERAWPLYEQALAIGERMGDPLLQTFVLARQGLNAYYRGAWDEAVVCAERAAKLIGPVRSAASAWPLCVKGLVCLARGEGDEAERVFADAIAQARHIHDLLVPRYAQDALAERDLLAGDAKRARERLEPLLDRPGQQEAIVTQVLPPLAWALLELGDVAAAAAAVEESCARAQAGGYRLALVDGLRIQALVWARRQNWEAASAALDESLAISRADRYPYAEARALYVAGLLRRAQGELEQAREHFERAREILDGLGERLYAEHVAAELAALPDA